jgi:hypothetical protein
MILRRIMEHLKSQNWLAVWLDLLVVIVGVFLGFQLSQWKEWSDDRVTERQYLDRLLVSTKDNMATLQQTEDLYREMVATTRQVLRLLDQPALSAEDEEKLRSGLAIIAFWRAITLNVGFAETLVNTGQISLIQNEQLQELVTQFLAANRDLERQLDNYRNWWTSLIGPYSELVKPSVRVDAGALLHFGAESKSSVWETARLYEFRATFKELRSPHVVSIYTLMGGARSAFLIDIQHVLLLANELHDELVIELENTSNRADG